MRSTFKVVAVGLIALTAVTLLSLRRADAPADLIKQELVRQADSLLTAVKVLQATPATLVNTAKLQQRFLKIRQAYKRIEWAVEYFDPLTTRQVNGPPVPETELNGQVIQPDGLQVIEQDLFPRLIPKKQQGLKDLLTRLTINATEFKDYFQHTDLQDWQILDAVKLEVFRVEALGLNRFDDPLSGDCFNESATAMESIEAVIANYPGGDRLSDNFNPAISHLRQPVSFIKFDRADFITRYANPLTIALTWFSGQMKLTDIRYNRLLNQNAATLFAPNVFNRNAYIAAPEDSVTVDKIALGKRLFFDTRLSGSMTRSCSSCHQPDKAFTDGLVKNRDLTGKKFITRNTPTLINAALQAAQFYDLRAASLEDQAIDVMRNRDEMHGDMVVSTQKLWQDTAYRRQFAIAFPVKERRTIDTLEVMNALASYVRSLTALNSRFDQYMQGDKKTLSAKEVGGFNLFMGKARCATCHYLPLFNGTLPPRYMQLDAEVIGVPQTRTGKHIDPDLGLYNLSPYVFNRHAFKTTTVRNAALTPPYMHNGVFRTLEEVVDFYNKGGGIGIGLNVPNQTLDAAPLRLTVVEKNELIAFIKSLNSH